MSVVCPQCRSNNTQSFQMAFQRGTSRGYADGRTFQQTGLAAEAAPPARPNPLLYGCFGIVVIFVGWLCAGLAAAAVGSAVMKLLPPPLAALAAPLSLLTLFGVTAGVALAVTLPLARRYRKARAAQQRELQEWHKQWLCLRCGITWQL